MSGPFTPGIGAVFSADIAVPDHDREVRFYSRVLSTGEAPLWQEDLTNNVGMPIIGLGKRDAQYAHLPLQWMPHIQVADVAVSVKRAVDRGGSVLMHHREDDRSHWAVLLDADGAAFGLIPLIPEPSGVADDASDSIGRIAWLDLTVPDADASRDFYREVVGWSVQDVAMVDGAGRYADYSMIGSDGNPAAGICHARGVNAAIPPVWMIYLPVGDIVESLRRVVEEGGAIVNTTKGADGDIIYAAVRDPVGVHFALAPA